MTLVMAVSIGWLVLVIECIALCVLVGRHNR